MARYNNNTYYDYMSMFSMPIHLLFFMAILFFVLGFSWYINYESKLEDLNNQVKIYLMLSPLLLLIVVHCLSYSGSTGGIPNFLPLPEERDSLHRAGGSAWGVAILLVFLLWIVSYQSSFHERWFPLYSK
ncbi:hypothetical protein ACFE04_028916 [Oxalis oulophora]